jgi:glycosyltransferase involved in cell wall biosynthesis
VTAPLSGTRICYFGRYDPNTLRNTITTKCLARAGAEIVSVHDDASLLRRTRTLIKRGRHAPPLDVVIVPFRAHSDVFTAWWVARQHGAALVFDPLTSRYEERVLDWRLAESDSLVARWYKFTDRAGCRLARCVLLETNAEIEYFTRTFSIARAKCRRVWLGADDEIMYPRAHPDRSARTADFTLFFYGRYSPLHGIEHIIRAAAELERRRDRVRFMMVGQGQTYSSIRQLASALGVTTVEFRDPVPYAELAVLMSLADACLGTFGTAERARRVIPYKVFDALAVARPVITADTPAIREALVPGQDVATCASGSGEALADAISALKRHHDRRRAIAAQGHRAFRDRFSLDAITADLVHIVVELRRGRVAAAVPG